MKIIEPVMKKSIQAKALNALFKYVCKPLQAYFPLIPGAMRFLRLLVSMGEKLYAHAPKWVHIDPVNNGKVTGEWLSTQGSDPNRVILFFHGGAFFCGSPRSHRPISWRLAHMANARVLSVDYRLMPENTLEDAVSDAVNAYHWLLESGCKPEHIVIGGDSAGGALTLFTLLHLKNESYPQPAAAFCMSPFLEYSGNNPSMVSNTRQSIMFHVNLVKSMKSFIHKTTDARCPWLSFGRADLSGLPPLFVQVSDNELLLDDSINVVRKYQDCGQTVVLNLWQQLPHAFSLFSDFLPEGRQGLRDISNFVKESVHTSKTGTG